MNQRTPIGVVRVRAMRAPPQVLPPHRPHGPRGQDRHRDDVAHRPRRGGSTTLFFCLRPPAFCLLSSVVSRRAFPLRRASFVLLLRRAPALRLTPSPPRAISGHEWAWDRRRSAAGVKPKERVSRCHNPNKPRARVKCVCETRSSSSPRGGGLCGGINAPPLSLSFVARF